MRLTDIEIKTYSVGDDRVFIISGGKAHIGGISTAFWHNNEVYVKTNELPHHKEGEISAELAELAAISTGQTNTVIMGIHIDNATKEEINYIVKQVKLKMDIILKNGATL